MSAQNIEGLPFGIKAKGNCFKAPIAGTMEFRVYREYWQAYEAVTHCFVPEEERTVRLFKCVRKQSSFTVEKIENET